MKINRKALGSLVLITCLATAYVCRARLGAPVLRVLEMSGSEPALNECSEEYHKMGACQYWFESDPDPAWKILGVMVPSCNDLTVLSIGRTCSLVNVESKMPAIGSTLIRHSSKINRDNISEPTPT